MCHHYYTRDSAREPEEESLETDDDLISPLEEAEPSEDVELLTDGSGEDEE